MKTLRALYDNSIRNFAGNKLFSLLEKESYTYAEFNKRVCEIQELLLKSGVEAGDKVAIFGRSMPNWSVPYFACVTIGIVAVPILPDFTTEQVCKLIEHSQAKAVFVSERLASLISNDIREKMNLVVCIDNLKIICRNVTKESLETAVMERMPKPDDLAVIIYTSGTTSAPKGVMLSHKAITAQLPIYRKFFLIDENYVFLSILPLSHVLECSIGMIYPFSVGASVVYLDRLPTAAALMPAFQKVRPTAMITVPLVIEKIYRGKILGTVSKNKCLKYLYEHIPLFRKAFHRIAGKKLMEVFGGRMKFIGIGGARLNTQAERFLKEGGIPYAIGYGLTETAPLLCAAAPGNTKIGTTGPALSGIKARIVNIDKNGEGELEVLTPSIMDGYYKNPEATAQVLTEDGWFRTNDVCRIDKKGYISIVGRANSMIVGPSGENIYPEDIENVLNTHELVSESIVIMDNGLLTALVCFDQEKFSARIGKMSGSDEDIKDDIFKDIMAFTNAKVGIFSRIKAVKEVEGGFQKTPTQKIRRAIYQRGSIDKL
ncbi:MAG: AMP-binding protein [Bacteroidales bacterium]|nr:AMP-binding protein [Bacteroidales bacterium]